MKRFLVTSAAIALSLMGIAQAHTTLQSAVPANNSVVTSPPTQIELNFAKPARLTALTVQKEGDKEAKAIAALPKDAATKLSVPIEPLAPGKYLVNWRVMGADNHLMSGVVRFTVDAK
jgi:methionine-rich copper-binding protein CopC